MGGVMKALVVCLSVIAIFAGGVASVEGAATPRTFVTHNCTGVKIEPRAIMFTCADGGFYVKRLEWGGWHRFRAVGRGVFHRNDCDPSCAGGTFHTAKGRLVLVRRLWCDDIDRYVFRRARIRYSKPLLGEDREGWRLGCPF